MIGRMGSRAAAACLVLGALAACDTRAQPTAAAGPAMSPDRLSKEQESCGTTAHCGEGLRCFDNVCRRADRSLVGDYYAALGAAARDEGDLEGALAHFGDALDRYEADKIVVPVDLECAYGAALAAGRSNKERAELAARVLHRCVAGAPAGSDLRQQALRAAAMLDEVGLDPEHLTEGRAADVYLSRAPRKPRSEDLKVGVTANPTPTAKSWPATVEAINGARAALVPCWEASFASSRKPVLSVALPMKSSYKDSGYDDEPGYYVTGIDPKAPPPATDSEKCVRDAVTAAVKSVKGGGDWTATVTVTVQ
jgi:hypothetical protein